MSLPQQLNYAQQVTELPDCNMNEVTITPSTGAGSTYTAGSVVKFDFPSSGFIDPQSIILRFQVVLPTVVTNTSQIRCTPAASFWTKLETLIGSSVVESIPGYNQVYNMWVNTNMDVASKYGLQSSYGWSNGTMDLTTLDGRVCNNVAAAETISFAIPLLGLLSNAAKLIPAFAMPQISVQLTVEALANIFMATSASAPATTIPANFTLQNIELTYNRLDFGKMVEQSVLSMPKLVFKSWSFTNSAVYVASGVSGQISLVYNQKLASIKSAFIHASGTTSLNGLFDAIDPTAGNGDISINVNGTQYPNRPLSTKNNLNYILQALRKANGNLNDKNNNLSINAIEFVATSANATLVQPAKAYFGIGLEKMHIPDDKAILAGVSSNGSNITVNINTATQTAAAYNVNLILAYDALFEVDTMNRDARIRQ